MKAGALLLALLMAGCATAPAKNTWDYPGEDRERCARHADAAATEDNTVGRHLARHLLVSLPVALVSLGLVSVTWPSTWEQWRAYRYRQCLTQSEGRTS